MLDFGNAEDKNIAKTGGVFVFFLFLAAVYFLLPTKNYYWDGIIYAQFIESVEGFGWNLVHPNHLFYNVLGYAAFKAAQGVELQTRALYVLQYVTAVFAVICAAEFFLISKRLFRSTYLGLVLTAILAFSAGWWRFSTDADVYIISITFLLAAFYFVLPGGRPRPLLVAVLHAFAMFFHELAVLLFPAFALGVYLQTDPHDKWERLTAALKYGHTAFLLTFGTYLLCFYFLTGRLDVRDFVAWTISFAPDVDNSRLISESGRLGIVMRGHRQLFIDGSTRLFNRDVLSVGLLVVFCAAALGFFIKFVPGITEIVTVGKTAFREGLFSGRIVLLCLAWVLPYLVFLWFFMPENMFYRLFYFPALVVLIGVVLAPFVQRRRTRRWRLALLALAFGLYNFLFYIYPNSNVMDGTSLAVARAANSAWIGKPVVFYKQTRAFDALSTNDRLVRYFNPTAVWKPVDQLTLEQLEEQVTRSYEGRESLWIESAALAEITADEQMARWLSDNTLQEIHPELSAAKYKLQYIRLLPRTQN